MNQAPAPPIPKYEQERLEALYSCGVLDTPAEPTFDSLADLASRLTDCPIALVSLVDQDRQWFKARVGLEVTQTPRKLAFCAYAVLANEPLVIPDTLEDERFRSHTLVTGEPHIRFYAGMPLQLATGEIVGTLCVTDQRPRHLSDRQIDDLRALAEQAVALLELRRTVRRLESISAAQQETMEALRASRDEAQAATRAKNEFVANTSHELRTPLNAIIGYATLLAERNVRDATRIEHASIIHRNASQLLDIINDILDLARIESGRVPIASGSLRPVDIVRDVMQLLQDRAATKGIALTAASTTTVPSAVLSDPARFRQILINIVGNAIKFTHKGTVHIELAHDPIVERLAVRVRDTGIGIAPEALPHLFEPFFQADASTIRRYGGTGLGLAISQRLAERLGGQITVRSEINAGSTFTIELHAPMAHNETGGATLIDPATIHARNADDESPHTPDPARSLAGKRVLLAEDGPDNQRLITHLLTRAGAIVHAVSDGNEACEAVAVAPEPFHLVLMDMQMPECSGYDATRILRERGCSTPVVALTASAMPGDRELCLKAGCDEYLTKPIEPIALVEACRRLAA
jgi:signal transduction histidine kinase